MRISALIISAAFILSSLLVSTTALPPYDMWCDINDDGKIDIKDVARVASHFGALGPDPLEFNKTEMLLDMQKDVFKSGLLLQLPFGATTIGGLVDGSTLLHSLDLNQAEPGNQQTVFVYKNTTIAVSGSHQRFQGGGHSGAILQSFFIYSWTPSWPPPNTTYYHPIYNGGPGPYPGTGIIPFSFDLTVPDTAGVYYLYFCTGAEYSMEDAKNRYTKPMFVPYAVIVVNW